MRTLDQAKLDDLAEAAALASKHAEECRRKAVAADEIASRRPSDSAEEHRKCENAMAELLEADEAWAAAARAHWEARFGPIEYGT